MKKVAEHGRNPGREKAELAAEAVGAVVIAPQFTEQEIAQHGYLSDWNDLATKTNRALEIPTTLEPAIIAAESERLKWAEAKNQVVREGETYEAEADQDETDSDDDQWSLTAGVLNQKQGPEALKPPAPKEASV